ncbi:hypothetical protein MUK42_31234 [Musa troglodytarum]|uniref:Uncharacterized protein n=1 Tax=Musa troglodytarum TaxID=320322 RepID=A0A9E7JPA6_9LILI|nr:hypothetical protein MUK42_31234 [Musa troglodytarum]
MAFWFKDMAIAHSQDNNQQVQSAATNQWIYNPRLVAAAKSTSVAWKLHKEGMKSGIVTGIHALLMFNDTTRRTVVVSPKMELRTIKAGGELAQPDSDVYKEN